jgi:hypothetical protein
MKITLMPEERPRWQQWVAVALAAMLALLLLVSISVPNLLRSRSAASYAVSGAPVAAEPQRNAVLEAASYASEERRVVSRGALTLLVSDVPAIVERVRATALSAGGYVESMTQARSNGEVRQASLALRVPAARFDAVRSDLRALGGKLESEHIEAREVTAEYTDLAASLRNFRAEEAQYLGIMQRAGSIKDTLEVARQLADVRGRIERTHGRLNLLEHQVAMASLDLTLRSELLPAPAEARWQPLAQARASFRSAAENLAAWLDLMIAVLLQLPVILLWVFTVAGGAALSWRVLRWLWRKWFAPLVTAQSAS